MPKAKLVTRTASTTSVTTDNIPKDSGLTNALSNFGTGQTINIKIKQDSTGGKTATFSGVKFAFGDSTIANGANAISFVTIFNDGTDKLAAVNRSYA